MPEGELTAIRVLLFMSKTAGGFIHRGNKLLWEPGQQVRESKLRAVGFTISMATLIRKKKTYIYIFTKKLQHTDTHKNPVIIFLQSSGQIKKVW